MSTWFTESFRGQILWDYGRGTNLTIDEWTAFAKRTDVWFKGGKIPATEEFDGALFPSGYCRDVLTENDTNAQEMIRIFGKKAIKGPAGCISRALLTGRNTFKCGLNAVYKIFHALTEWSIPADMMVDRNHAAWIKKFISQCVITTAYSSRSQPHVMEEGMTRMDWKKVAEAENWMALATTVRNLITMRWHTRVRRAYTGKERMFNVMELGKLMLPDEWIVLYDSWVTYIQTPEMDPHEYYALTTVDIDRLQQMCVSRAMLELHQATYRMTAGNDTAAIHYKSLRTKMEKILYDALARTDEVTAQHLCRDMKKYFSIYLSQAAGPLSDNGTLDLLREAQREKYGSTFNSSAYLSALRAAPFDIAQDLGRLFKILPAPDYDIGESYVARYKELMEPNPIEEVGGPNPSNIDEFKLYQRKLMIITLTVKAGGKGVGKLKTLGIPKWWKDYVEHGRIPAGIEWTRDIDLTGVAKYIMRNEDSAVAYKDTASTEEDLETAQEDASRDNVQRNMLLRYLFDSNCPTQDQARKMLTRADHVHRVGFKMEAHKPVARIFYIGNMADRLIQSEMEENVHRIAQKTPGYMIGQSAEFAIGKTMHMVAPQLAGGERVFYLNFDLKRWSPGMASEPQRATHELFGEIFDRREFHNAYKINENSIVLLNKRGYHGLFRNKVGNFEGYNGKEMTWLHCSLMGYAVYRYNRGFSRKISIELCAFIDDGLAAYKDDVHGGSDRFLELVEVVRQTYASLGYVLELSKCYLSDTFAIFLNEIYFAGRHVTYGLRSVMRIGTTAPEQTDTIMDEFSSKAAGCQGAMKSGMDLISAYIVFLWTCAHSMLNAHIDRYMDAHAAALMFYAPKAFGGFQQPNLIAISSNLSSDGLAESISTVQHMAKAYPSYKTSVIRLIKSAVDSKSDESMLIAPRTVKAFGSSIAETRLKQAVYKRLLSSDLAPRAKRLIDLGKGFDMAALARAVVQPNTVLVESLLTDIKEATPFAIVMALVTKFESASTIQQLIGRGQVMRIIRMQRKELAIYLESFVRRARS